MGGGDGKDDAVVVPDVLQALRDEVGVGGQQVVLVVALLAGLEVVGLAQVEVEDDGAVRLDRDGQRDPDDVRPVCSRLCTELAGCFPRAREVLLDALHPSRRGTSDEAILLRKALGVSDGVAGLMQGVIKAGRVDRGIELNQLEQRAWVRLGELVAFDGKS